MKYKLISLGCQMNFSDTERISAVLEKEGFSETSSDHEADILGVIACSVRQKAIDRIYSQIHEWNKWKDQKSLITFVSGCILPEDEKKFLKLFDLVFRIDDLPRLPEFIRSSGVVTPFAVNSSLTPQRSVTLNNSSQFWGITPHYKSSFVAYVPIQNGCDKFCTFCAVPYTRGREISRPRKDIINEIEKLILKGFRSIVLLGQNVNSYGYDSSSGKADFDSLLADIGRLCDSAKEPIWVYFTSPHPADMSISVLETIAKYKSLANQIHLPLQSGDDKILIRMNRNHCLEEYRAVVKNIREILPEATLFTDIIVGFCGETEVQFQKTRDALEEFRFDMAYIAMYSPRPGAVAARWTDTVSREEKKSRLHILSDDLQTIALNQNRKLEGFNKMVLVESNDRKSGFLFGRTEGRIPVRFKSNLNLIGEIVEVVITNAKSLSLEAEYAENYSLVV